jgi:DNA (cytosine-5)-methyltransferase 1
MRPRLLDLFCGAGGAAMGYFRAGFEVVGVDIKPQPHYPFEFIEADALVVLRYLTRTPDWSAIQIPWEPFDEPFDAIHASPPCQAFSAMRVMANARPHPDLLAPTRQLLLTWGGPFVIENVEQAPMDSAPLGFWSALSGVVLCGSMFGLRTDQYELRRHRQFESTMALPTMVCRHSKRQVVGFYGDHARTRTRVNGHHARGTDITRNDDKLTLVRDLMGIDWMAWPEANQAIPPAYTEFIGRQLIAALEHAV